MNCGRSELTTQIQTKRFNHVITAQDIIDGSFGQDVEFDVPFPDTNFTASALCQDVSGLAANQAIPVDCHVIDSQNMHIHVLLVAPSEGNTIRTHVIAIHD